MGNKISPKELPKDFLTGIWKNEFMVDGKKGFEICEIKADGKYYIDGVHWFDVIDINYDHESNKISFVKSAVQTGDERKFYNIVVKINNGYLVNIPGNIVNENTYSIGYKRLKGSL